MSDITREEFEKILRTDPEIVAIHWPPDWEFGEINRDLWSARADRQVKRIGLLEGYLRGPCVEDTFGSDELARREWRGKSRRSNMTEYENALWYDCSQNNALRYGSLALIVDAAGRLFRDYVGGNQQEMAPYIQELGNMAPKSLTEYEMLTTRQKIELVGRLKEKLFHVLRNFYMPDIPNYD